ncbi:MAG TPA: response regulator [Chloroflexota bacterium]|jgi:two-component system cell cycle response regulator DivK
MGPELVVLIVEDNERNLELVRDLLELRGFRTLEAANAEAGIAVARAHRPDVVLMDVQLPDIDGVDALGRLRADPATRAIPVVALTAFAMKDDRMRFMDAGFDGYLMKPIDIRTFPDEVRRYCLPEDRRA